MPIDADAITDELFSKCLGRDGMVRMHTVHKEVICQS